jgi:hypothetical protein
VKINISYKVLVVILMGLLGLALSSSLSAQEGEGGEGGRAELERQSPIALNPASGSEVGFVYEAFLSPMQEGGEEEDTPALIPPEFRSTQPSVPRSERTSRGHAVIEFTNDLSRAYVYLAVENVNAEDVNLLHLHCGRPGQLGPIIVDFSLAGDVPTYLADGTMSIEITNEDIVAVTDHGHSLIGAFTAGCAIDSTNPADKVHTIAGLETIAREGGLYFNLHTYAQTYFGDIRGQFHLVENLP